MFSHVMHIVPLNIYGYSGIVVPAIYFHSVFCCRIFLQSCPAAFSMPFSNVDITKEKRSGDQAQDQVMIRLEL